MLDEDSLSLLDTLCELKSREREELSELRLDPGGFLGIDNIV